MVVLGIDPGATGGLAVVSTAPDRLPLLEEAMLMPMCKRGNKNIVDAETLHRWLLAWSIDQVVIEQVTAFGMGLATAFAFGRSCGSVETVAQLICPRIEWVTPNVWKKHFQLPGGKRNKQASLDLAKRKFGEMPAWSLKKNDGIAEAALMCQWFLDRNARM